VPERAAVVAPEETLSYGELEARSNRLARRLRAAGIAIGDRVGIDLDKSAASIVGIFGTLKAGAAYVPIDPRAPAARVAFLVKDCVMRGLITTRERMARLRGQLEFVPPCIVLVEAGWDSEGAPDAPACDAIEQDLAYILYTSGSTGEPKGVMLTHRAALAFVNWAQDSFAFGPQDRLANHAPLHFDLSVLDVFGAIGAGASVALVPPGVSVFPRSLADWIERAQVSVWYSVPSALVQLALHGALERHAYASLRLVLFAGEVFPVRHLRALMEHLPRARYCNLYGPTETNVCTWHEVSAPPDPGSPPVPIGRACANTEVFALDDDGREVETGGTGELYARGPTLMEGYWGRPERSAQSLLADPRGPAGGRGPRSRAYRTGDLVRLDEDGCYHYIGRRDAQVKSRGYRIELGEVEATLLRHPGIAEAAVIALPHEEFGCTLHAVVVARAPASVGRDELAAFCAELLPPYMMPSEFRFRDGLPKTSNGKVDRVALRGL
jgi:amino acid adenylation domain-containing protein